MTKYYVLAALLAFSGCAQAYIDPGSGSFLLQMLFASLIGAGLTLKMYFKAFKEKMRRLLGKTDKVEQEQNPHA
jgi:hypothetical protein